MIPVSLSDMASIVSRHVRSSRIISIRRTGWHDVGDRVEGEAALVVGEREADAELVVVAVGDDLVMLEPTDDDAGMDAGFSG